MDTPRTLRPHLEIGDICVIGMLVGDDEIPDGPALVVGGVEGQVVDLLVEGRLIKINRRWLNVLSSGGDQ